MSRLATSVASITVGVLLAAPVIILNYSLSNVGNLGQLVMGVLLVLYGATRWIPSTTVDRASWDGAIQPVELAPQPRMRGPRTKFERAYITYLKYLLLLPAAITLACWMVSFKLLGCAGSGASMQSYGCGIFGQAISHLYLYLMMFTGMMLALFIPLTVVYLVHFLGRRRPKNNSL